MRQTAVRGFVSIVAGIVSAWCAALAALAAETAASYPARPVRMIVPFATGGGSDIVGRIMAQGLNEHWRQSVVVDNRPGAGSTLGTALAARAAADGYTVLVSSSAIAFSPALYKSLSYDIRRDFTPITLLARQPSILAVAATVAVGSVKELIEMARAHPGKLTFGSAGVGSATHLGGELLRYAAALDMTHVPYKSAGLAMTALLANEVHVLMTNTATVLPHLANGRVRALATSGRMRSALVPELPTIAESALPGFEYDTWYAMLAPAGLPAQLASRLHVDSAAVMTHPRYRERFASLGIDIAVSSPQALREFLAAEVAKWGRVIRVAGL